jgi:tumor protein p53-inducible protein 3
MKAITIDNPGGAEKLKISDYPDPIPGPDEILVKVKATALNRADILQREGKYPPPKGASPILGLELAGDVIKVGDHVKRWKTGDKVFGLLPGGGYAEYAVIHQDMAMPIPANFSYIQASAVPEVFLTAFQALVWLANIQKKSDILIHAGASGVGTAAIQIAKAFDANIIITASSPKHDLCRSLGANHTIDYKKESFSEQVMDITQGKGVDCIIDFIGAAYFKANIDSLKTDGKLILLAALSGIKIESFNMAKILVKRLNIIGSTLRSRPLDYQIQLTKAFASFGMEKLKSGALKPVIDSVYNWKDVQEAHRYMEANKNAGKIILEIN